MKRVFSFQFSVFSYRLAVATGLLFSVFCFLSSVLAGTYTGPNTFTGSNDFRSGSVFVPTPTNAYHAAHKGYADMLNLNTNYRINGLEQTMGNALANKYGSLTYGAATGGGSLSAANATTLLFQPADFSGLSSSNDMVTIFRAANPGFVLNNSVSTNNVQVTNAINFAVTFNKPVTFNETVTQQTRIENLTIVDNGTNYINSERHTTNYYYEVTVRENATNIIDTAIGWQFNNSYLNATNAIWVGTPHFMDTKGGSLVATGTWDFASATITGLALGGGTTNQWWLNGAAVGTNDTLEIENGNTNTLSVTSTNIGSRMKYTFTGLATPQNFGVGGDLSGTTTNASVVALRGNSVSSASPQSNYVLAWVGNAWTPTSTATLPASSMAVTNVLEVLICNTASGNVTNTLPTPTTVTYLLLKTNAANNLVVRYSSSTNTISGTATVKAYPAQSLNSWVLEW